MKTTLPIFALAALSAATPISPVERGIPSLRQLQCLLDATVSKVVNKVSNGAANSFCSSFIASTTTTTKTSTVTSLTTAISTVPLTATVSTVATAPAPTVTVTVYSDCGVPGYDKVPTINYEGSGAYGTFDTCSARCAAEPKCASFAVGGGACLLYDVPVASNLNPVETSPFYFYDVKCPASSVPAAAAAPVAPIAVASANSTAPQRRGEGMAFEARAPPPPPAPTPAAFAGYQPARISQFCSCAIQNPSTSTIVASTTATVPSTIINVVSVTVATSVVTSTVTPPASTVTVTTSVA